MVSIPDSSITIQTSSQSIPSTPPWFGEVTLVAQYLKHLDLLSALEEQVRFARSRFGHYDTIDFIVVLFGYAISGERTLKALYERVHPFATQFMALFGRSHLPHRSSALAGSWKPLSPRRSRRCARSFSRMSYLDR